VSVVVVDENRRKRRRKKRMWRKRRMTKARGNSCSIVYGKQQNSNEPSGQEQPYERKERKKAIEGRKGRTERPAQRKGNLVFSMQLPNLPGCVTPFLDNLFIFHRAIAREAPKTKETRKNEKPTENFFSNRIGSRCLFKTLRVSIIFCLL
jgi:hypothetical protein